MEDQKKAPESDKKVKVESAPCIYMRRKIDQLSRNIRRVVVRGNVGHQHVTGQRLGQNISRILISRNVLESDITSSDGLEIIDQRNLYLEDILAVQRDGITEEMRASWIAVVEATADVEATEA